MHTAARVPSRQPIFFQGAINGRPVLRMTASPARYLTSPVVVTPPYTALFFAQQTGPARGRMLSTLTNNWLLGWHGGNKRMAHFDAWVSPTFVPQASLFARTEGPGNAAVVTCTYAGEVTLSGQGAGGDATAVAIVGDLLAIARDRAAIVPAPVLAPAASVAGLSDSDFAEAV